MNKTLETLKQLGAVIPNDHFVFKAGHMHGNLYVDKNQFLFMGAGRLVKMIIEMVDETLFKGLNFGDAKEVGVIGPAFGAIPFSLIVAFFLEERFPAIKFFPARTELKKDENGRDVHYLPEKLIKDYQGKKFIGVEDIVNNGTTIREVIAVFREQADAVVTDFLCLVNRAGQTKETLGLHGFYPLIDLILEQFDLLLAPCPLCVAGVPINTKIGKGKEWVKMFGQPPYKVGADFSQFWTK